MSADEHRLGSPLIATAIRRCLAVAPLVAACACPAPAPDPPPQAPPLQQVTAWACQLQGIELDTGAALDLSFTPGLKLAFGI